MDSVLWGKGRLGKYGREPQIIFAQVREESAIELEVLRSLPSHQTVFCIASGGCTAFSLLLARPAQLQVVDVNPAQIFLVELKSRALDQLSEKQFKDALLHDARSFYSDLRPCLSQATQQFWDKRPHLLAHGLNQCGIIEQRLKQIMRLLPLVQSRRNQRCLFGAATLEEQRHIYQQRWNHWRWKLAFDIVLSKPILRLVYGRSFIDAMPAGFAAQIKQRMDATLIQHPLRKNGYLWQTFRGCYPPGEAGLPPYLQSTNLPIVRRGLSSTHIICADAMQWLEAQPANSIGFFALSNILEVASPEYARRLLQAITRAAKSEALVCLRSIFPFNDAQLEQAKHGGDLKYEAWPNMALEASDRSFFCTNLRVLKIVKE